MERREIEGDHDICTYFFWTTTAVAIFILGGVVVRAIDHELLSSTLWLNNDVVDKDRGVGDL